MIRTRQSVEKLVFFYLFVGLVTPVLQPPATSTPSGSLVINEVMFHPSENENTNEWIELYNPTSEPIDVTGWMIADEKETDTILGDMVNGDGTSVIPPEGFGLLTDKGTTVYDTASVPEDVVRLSVDDSTLCGYGLNNQEEKILLFDQENNLVDAIEWGQDYEDVPGGPFGTVAEGNSLARYPGVDTDDSTVDFYECDAPSPGSKNIPMTKEEPPAEESPAEKPSNETIEEVTASLLITELYYDTHPTINAEYITLTNPLNTSVDVSGWYLTDKPWKEPDDRPKILFPEHTFMPSETSWVITKDASAFLWETALSPDFEYGIDSLPTVPQLPTFRSISLSNTGGLVGVYSASHRLVDLIIYGEADEYVSGWEGPAIPSSGQGVILKRNIIHGTWVDTNSASDWIHPRIYQIGQSEFVSQIISCTGEVTMFVSPDNSYETIAHELRNARSSIILNMYEFTNPFLYQELLDALQRNVTLQVFMEGAPIGGIDDREAFILLSLAAHGGQVRLLVSDEIRHVNTRYQFDHAKYLIIDNETVIVESGNWAKTGIPKNPSYGNREWGIVIRNKELAERFWQVFQDDWDPRHLDSYPIERMNMTFYPDFTLDEDIPTGDYQPCFDAETFKGNCSIIPVFSPDNSEQVLLDAIDAATTTIYIQQLYIYKNWSENLSPLIEHLANKSAEGVQILVILNDQASSNEPDTKLEETTQYLEAAGVKVKHIASDWSPFSTVHNKGMVIDNTTVLISSINWNEQSVRKNREAGVLVTSREIATYYASVFLSDWNLKPSETSIAVFSWADYKYLVLVAVVVCITLVFIARDWRKRKWT